MCGDECGLSGVGGSGEFEWDGRVAGIEVDGIGVTGEVGEIGDVGSSGGFRGVEVCGASDVAEEFGDSGDEDELNRGSNGNKESLFVGRWVSEEAGEHSGLCRRGRRR